MQRRTLDANTLRQLAVKADCDPRTVRGVLSGQIVVKTMSSRRAMAVLIEAGFVEQRPSERAA